MKIKDKISGEVYEPETLKNWNGVVQYIKKGTNGPIRKSDDVEIIEEDKPKDTTDWESFRREAAKDILCAMISTKSRANPKDVTTAIEITEELIAKLKEK